MDQVEPFLSTSTSRRLDSALTTDAPTPCRPPVALYDPPPNFPPACSLVNTTSTPVRPVRGSVPTGLPRPPSRTAAEPSSCTTICISVNTPARASSTGLSVISDRQCMSARVSVAPSYMPGRLRTASRPSSTNKLRASYVVSIGLHLYFWNGCSLNGYCLNGYCLNGLHGRYGPDRHHM